MVGGISKLLRFAAVAVGCLSLLLAQPCAAAPPTEKEVKAVYLFHLTQFVTWPTNTNQSPEFVIGILGPDPFGNTIEDVLKGEKVGDRPIRVKRANNARELVGCPLVYVSPKAPESVAHICKELSEPTALTVGESRDFVESGGMIRFKKTSENKIRLQVHLSRARDHGFNVSAQLLRVSDVIEGGDE